MTLAVDKSTWTKMRFEDFVQNVTDRVDDPSTSGVDRYVGLEHLDPGTMVVSRWGSPDEVEAQKLRFRRGDVIFGRRRAYQKKVARADFDGICSAHALVLRARPERVHPDFLPVFLSSDLFLDRAIKISVGSLSPTVNWRDLKVQEFLLPPLADQQRIADLLWSLYSDRDSRKKINDALSNLRFLAIEAVFGRIEGGRTLSDYCELDGIRIGPFGAQLHVSDYVNDGVPVVMPQDLDSGRIDVSSIKQVSEEKAQELSLYRLREGDILLPRRGDLDRRALVTEQESGWLCGTGSVRVRPKEGVNPEALILALSSRKIVEWLESHSTGTTMPNINAGIVAKIPVQLPDPVVVERKLLEVRALDDALTFIKDDLSANRAMERSLSLELFGSVV